MDGDDMRARLKIQPMIKEALDNLPNGVCFFNKRGVPVLVNRTMHRLIFMLTRRDLQNISDIDEILGKDGEIFPGDGSVWRFAKRTVGENGDITEVSAADITELYRRRRELEKANEEQRDIMRRLENVSRNVVSITRNEEILAMKMRVHNELGYAISATRRFITQELSAAERDEYIENQRKIAKMLLNEIGNDDETHVFAELRNIAEKLGMEIISDGELPAAAEELIAKAVRECLINTVRHAQGDKVYLKTDQSGGSITAVITNNGKPPESEITEGGGLSALRKSIENAGGSMKIISVPEFSVTVTLPVPEEA